MINAVRNFWRRWRHLYFPEPPAAIMAELEILQYSQIRDQLPTLYVIGILNSLIVMTAAYIDDLRQTPSSILALFHYFFCGD